MSSDIEKEPKNRTETGPRREGREAQKTPEPAQEKKLSANEIKNQAYAEVEQFLNGLVRMQREFEGTHADADLPQEFQQEIAELSQEAEALFAELVAELRGKEMPAEVQGGQAGDQPEVEEAQHFTAEELLERLKQKKEEEAKAEEPEKTEETSDDDDEEGQKTREAKNYALWSLRKILEQSDMAKMHSGQIQADTVMTEVSDGHVTARFSENGTDISFNTRNGQAIREKISEALARHGLSDKKFDHFEQEAGSIDRCEPFVGLIISIENKTNGAASVSLKSSAQFSRDGRETAKLIEKLGLRELLINVG